MSKSQQRVHLLSVIKTTSPFLSPCLKILPVKIVCYKGPELATYSASGNHLPSIAAPILGEEGLAQVPVSLSFCSPAHSKLTGLFFDGDSWPLQVRCLHEYGDAILRLWGEASEAVTGFRSSHCNFLSSGS